jgi:hypothetical protein
VRLFKDYAILLCKPVFRFAAFFDRSVLVSYEIIDIIGYDDDCADSPKYEGNSCFKIHDSIKNLWHNQLQEWVDYSNKIREIKREKKEKRVNRKRKIKSWLTNLVKRKGG